MSIPVTCPACNATFNVSESLLGKTLRCKSCKEAFKARAPDPDEDDEPRRPSATNKLSGRRRDEDDEPDDADVRPARKSKREAKTSPVAFIIGSVIALVLAVGAVVWVVTSSGYFDKKPVDKVGGSDAPASQR